jgi:hypothetical protein
MISSPGTLYSTTVVMARGRPSTAEERAGTRALVEEDEEDMFEPQREDSFEMGCNVSMAEDMGYDEASVSLLDQAYLDVRSVNRLLACH